MTVSLTIPAASFPTRLSVPQPTITHDAAVELIEAVRGAAAAAGVEVAVAVVDPGGHLRAFQRTDGAPFLAATVALDKAWTAASFHTSTHVWNDYLTDPHLAPLGHHPRLMAVAGGLAVMESGTVIGGLGVSGGSAEQDQQVAETAIQAIGLNAHS